MIQTVSETFPGNRLLDLGALAGLLQDHSSRVREPGALLELVSVCEQRSLEMGREGRLHWVQPTPEEGVLEANMFHKYELLSAYYSSAV